MDLDALAIQIRGLLALQPRIEAMLADYEAAKAAADADDAGNPEADDAADAAPTQADDPVAAATNDPAPETPAAA